MAKIGSKTWKVFSFYLRFETLPRETFEKKKNKYSEFQEFQLLQIQKIKF